MPLVSKTFSQIITFTRASSATYFDAAGVLQTATTDVPRFDYNPSTLAALGLLIEETRTNSIRNNTMQGAVAGTPGTAPTNWQRFTSGTAATSIVGTGTESGITYVDVAFSGGNTDGISFFIDGNTGHAALNGQTWTGSAYYKLTAGSFANCTINHVVYEANSSGTALAASPITLTTVTTASLSTQRFAVTRTNNNAATAEEQFAVVIVGTGAFSFTLRIGLPQLELGAFATSVIPTTTTAVTRAADVASVNTLSPWYNASSGTLSAEFSAPASGTRTMADLNDTTATESIRLRTVSTNPFFTVTDGTDQADIDAGTVASNTVYKFAGAYAANDFATCINGGTVQTDNSGTLPAVTQMLLGADASGNALNGYLRRITYYPRRLSNAELVSITS